MFMIWTTIDLWNAKITYLESHIQGRNFHNIISIRSKTFQKLDRFFSFFRSNASSWEYAMYWEWKSFTSDRQSISWQQCIEIWEWKSFTSDRQPISWQRCIESGLHLLQTDSQYRDSGIYEDSFTSESEVQMDSRFYLYGKIYSYSTWRSLSGSMFFCLSFLGCLCCRQEANVEWRRVSLC